MSSFRWIASVIGLPMAALEIFHGRNIIIHAVERRIYREFGEWWETLTEDEQDDVTAVVSLLMERGPQPPFPHSSGINESKHGHMRELRVQSGGRPLRAFYAFDPRRTAILLIGGDKTGDDRFYKTMVPIADGLYDEHISELKKEGLLE